MTAPPGPGSESLNPGDRAPGEDRAPEEGRAPERIRIRGAASPEELAAVLAVLTAVDASPPEPTPYERWRRGRQELARVRRA